MSLNPALEDAGYCPRCGAGSVRVDFPRSLRCQACGYAVFFNPKPVGCAIGREPDGRVWLARRGFEPQRGRWSMPGGFVDLGETVEEAAQREAREEIRADVELTDLVGVYSNAGERIVLIVFAASIEDEPQTTAEALQVQAFPPDEIPWEELAFWSTTNALKDFLARS